MNNIIKSNNEVVTISSREVAKMVGVRHKDLLKKIDGVNEVFKSEKVRPSIYWEEGTYKQNGNGKKNREFKITKRGCGFIAHKTPGEKGIIFTHKYMEKFEQMEKELYGELVPVKKLEEKIQNTVTKEIDRLRKEHAEYIKPLSTEKRRISQYIKERLGIDKANDEYKQVKNRVLMLLGAEKWEDVPVETLLNSMNLIDESISVIKSERPYKQMNWF